jgi:hypothetical protein
MGAASIDLAHRISERFRLRQRAEVTNQSHLVIGIRRADLEAQRAVGSDTTMTGAAPHVGIPLAEDAGLPTPSPL